MKIKITALILLMPLLCLGQKIDTVINESHGWYYGLKKYKGDVYFMQSMSAHWGPSGTVIYKLNEKFDSAIVVNAMYPDFENYIEFGEENIVFQESPGSIIRTDGTEDGTKVIWQNGYIWSKNIHHFKDQSLLIAAEEEPMKSVVPFIVKDDPEDAFILKRVSVESDIYSLNNTALFIANDTVHGSELWKTEGTSESTVMLKNISPETNSIPDSTTFGSFYRAGDIMFFIVVNNKGYELWKTDGTELGTISISSFPEDIRFYNSINNQVIFCSGTNLFSMDVSSGILTLLTVFSKDYTFQESIINKDNLYFRRLFNDDGNYDSQIWRTDGTAEGTKEVTDIFPGAKNADWSSVFLKVIDGELYFTNKDEKLGCKLWKTNGTKEGTELIVDILPDEEFANLVDILDTDKGLLAICNIDHYSQFGRVSESKIYLIHTEDPIPASLIGKRESGITIAPNPCNEFIQIRFPENIKSSSVQYSLRDLSGTEIFSSEATIENNISIPMENIKAGVYLITIQSDLSIETLKVYKK